MALPSFSQVEKYPFGTVPMPHLSFSYPFAFSHPFHLENTASVSWLPWELQHWPGPCGRCCIAPLGSLAWGCSWALGRNFMELGNLPFPFSFVSLQARLAPRELSLDASLAGLRAVLGHQTAPNPFSGAQQHSVVSSGLGGLSCPCFVCSVRVPRAFGWLPPVRLHCPVSSQPPGERMLGLWRLLLGVTQLSLPLSLPAGCLPAGRGVLTHSSLPGTKQCCGLWREFSWALGCFFSHPAESFFRQSQLCEQPSTALPFPLPKER